MSCRCRLATARPFMFRVLSALTRRGDPHVLYRAHLENSYPTLFSRGFILNNQRPVKGKVSDREDEQNIIQTHMGSSLVSVVWRLPNFGEERSASGQTNKLQCSVRVISRGNTQRWKFSAAMSMDGAAPPSPWANVRCLRRLRLSFFSLHTYTVPC